MSKRKVGDIDSFGRTRRWELKKSLDSLEQGRLDDAEVLDEQHDSDQSMRSGSIIDDAESSEENVQGAATDVTVFSGNRNESENKGVQENDLDEGGDYESEVVDNEDFHEIPQDVHYIPEDEDEEEIEYEDDEEEIEDDKDDEEEIENDEDVEDTPILDQLGGGGDGDGPLYDGAPITLAESMIAVLTLSIVHNLTGSCLADILSLIFLHCKKPTLFKNTLYKFRQFFKKIKSPIVRHHYCTDCLTYLENQEAPCSCEHRKSISYFIEIPIAHQLVNLFRRRAFYEDLQYRFNRTEMDGIIGDIYDGSLYKKLFKPGRFLSDKNNISFTWYSDGIPVFKSKKYSLWPMYLVINELPYHKRFLQQNILVAGLWFGPKDPVVNLFLKPLHSQLETLSSTGIEVRAFGLPNPVTVKAIVLYGTADTPAKSDFLCHVRFNGDYGCTTCNAKGYTISGENFGNTHVYPFEGMEKVRTQTETDRRATTALDTRKPVFGVKGPSLLSKIMPDAVRGVCTDVMHCLFLGVVKKLCTLWFDSKFRFDKFSMYRYVDVIDARLVNLKPPAHVQRLPRSIANHIAYFKASEYKNWFFFYSLPVIHDLMDPVCLDHYLKLVMAVYILSSDSVSVTMLATAENLLIAFVSQFQVLYDVRFMSINIHLLLHLPQVVKHSGPLWVTSCFPFEDLNGKIVRKIHGSTHIGLQVYSSVAHSIVLPYLASQLPEAEPKLFSLRLLDFEQRQNLTEIYPKIYIVGRLIQRTDVVPLVIRQTLETAMIPYKKVSLFYRLKRGKQLFSSTSYSRSTSHISHYILFENEAHVNSIGVVNAFIRICQCTTRECNNDECSPQFFAVVVKGSIQTYFSASDSMIIGDNRQLYSLPYLYMFTPGNTLTLEPVDHVKRVCFVVEIGTKTFVAQPINVMETE